MFALNPQAGTDPAMNHASVLIERAGHAVIQDLGRIGYAHIGIANNGAADQNAARTANILVGNPDNAPVLEATGSDLSFRSQSNLLMAVTGAADVLVDGTVQPAWEPIAIFPESLVTVRLSRDGLRTYVAFNGILQTPAVLGSVTPDALLRIGRLLGRGDKLLLHSYYAGPPPGVFSVLFRFAVHRPSPSSPVVLDATAGPDAARLRDGLDGLTANYTVSAQSNQVGIRLTGLLISQNSSEEILSRGVPVGAIETPPGGGLIVLLRGRLLTAGYPVIGVVTTEAIDKLAQVSPGATISFRFCDVDTARQKLAAREQALNSLANHVRTAFQHSGLGSVLDPHHRSFRRILSPS
jgi:5-oxoprolinase (ATP-hydrolysing) subunit C